MRQALILPRPLAVCGVASLRDDQIVALGDLDNRQRKQMSRAAWLALHVVRRVLADAGFTDRRQDIGAFFGVGGSGPALSELSALLAGSSQDGNFSLKRFGERGLYEANPLLAFQLMNNFTLCHATINSSLGGPSGALFSRGAGTVFALQSAAWSILEGDCDRALAGGADSALHAVTRAELDRQGALAAGLVPGEGAAALALSVDDQKSAVELFACAVISVASSVDSLLCSLDADALSAAVTDVLHSEIADDIDTIVTSGAVESLRTLFRDRIKARFSDVTHRETAADSETLAAAPALAWASAISALRSHRARRVLVLSAGLDGELGVVGLRRRA